MSLEITLQTKLEGDDYVIYVQENVRNFDKGSTFTYAIEKSECEKSSYATLFGLVEYLSEQVEAKNTHTSKHVKINTSDIHCYNILNTYLKKWKQNAWMGSKGPISHLEMLQELWELLHSLRSVEIQLVKSVGNH